MISLVTRHTNFCHRRICQFDRPNPTLLLQLARSKYLVVTFCCVSLPTPPLFMVMYSKVLKSSCAMHTFIPAHRIHIASWCSVVRCGAVWCDVVQCDAVWCDVVQCGAMWFSVMQCGAMWCSVVQAGSNTKCRHLQLVTVLLTLVWRQLPLREKISPVKSCSMSAESLRLLTASPASYTWAPRAAGNRQSVK
ncbi:glutamine-rich protein 2 [Elysia marginata]|uniref:Glutamine-rich protein 2 n=1 Tax=Elysia marginata TaxID=1093978 RepID=A0AAV4JXB2_9GAST|nr:glutamine-rich protein 2 [Elysia marginata]